MPRSISMEQHGIVRIRVRPGHDATLLNISPHGAAIETSYRLLPGTIVELQLETQHGRAGARGRITRCAVAAVEASRISYRGALCFQHPVTPWPLRFTE